MILSDVEGKFLNWSDRTEFVGKFIGFEEITIKGVFKKMAVFVKNGYHYYIGNLQVLRILNNNIENDIIGLDMRITKKDVIKTAVGNMITFEIETTEENSENPPF